MIACTGTKPPHACCDLQVTDLMQATLVTPETAAHASSVLQDLQAESGTNLSGGLIAGLHQLVPRPLHRLTLDPVPSQISTSSGADLKPLIRVQNNQSRAGSARAVFLLTDGRPTTGIRSSSTLLREISYLIRQPRHPHQNCAPAPRVFCFGYGTDHDTVLLGNVATSTGGAYYFVRKPEDVAAAFADALGGLMSVAALDVRISITPKHGAIIARVRSGFRHRRVAGKVIVSIPDISAEQSKDLLVEFDLPAVTHSPIFVVAEVSASYYVPAVGSRASKAAYISINCGGDGTQAAANTRVTLQRMRLHAASRMRRAVSLADSGDLPNARRHVRRAREYIAALQVDALAGTHSVPSRIAASFVELEDDLKELEPLLDTMDTYTMLGSKQARMFERSHACQHSKLSTFVVPRGTRREVKPSSYANTPQSAMLLRSRARTL
jgi:hypothetical protein